MDVMEQSFLGSNEPRAVITSALHTVWPDNHGGLPSAELIDATPDAILDVYTELCLCVRASRASPPLEEWLSRIDDVVTEPGLTVELLAGLTHYLLQLDPTLGLSLFKKHTQDTWYTSPEQVTTFIRQIIQGYSHASLLNSEELSADSNFPITRGHQPDTDTAEALYLRLSSALDDSDTSYRHLYSSDVNAGCRPHAPVDSEKSLHTSPLEIHSTTVQGVTTSQSADHQSVYHTPASIGEGDVDAYLPGGQTQGMQARAWNLLLQTQRELSEKSQQLVLLGDGDSRLHNHCREYRQILKSAHAGQAVPFRAFAKHKDNLSDFLTANPYIYLVCHDHEVGKVLDHGPLRIPLVVPRFKSHTVNAEDFIESLRYGGPISMQVFDRPGNDVQSMPPDEALNRLSNHGTCPVNFLDLRGSGAQGCPDVMASATQYSLIQWLVRLRPTGKPATRDEACDLESCTAFHILGGAGSISLPHVDHVGVTTTVIQEGNGKKLWMMYPEMSKDQHCRWTQSGDLDDSFYPIALEQGDLLIQPAGRVHAPYSPVTTLMSGSMHLMSGSMHWHPQQLCQIAEAAINELTHSHVTNEKVPEQLIRALRDIGDLWSDRKGLWHWPPLNKLPQFRSLLNTLELLHVHHCGCQRTCSQACGCRKRGVNCTSWCSCPEEWCSNKEKVYQDHWPAHHTRVNSIIAAAGGEEALGRRLQ